MDLSKGQRSEVQEFVALANPPLEYRARSIRKSNELAPKPEGVLEAL